LILDASAVVELLRRSDAGERVASLLEDPGVPLDVPHLLDVEVLQALRRLVMIGELNVDEAAEALDTLSALDFERHGHESLLERAWTLRENYSAYDAVYVALAESLDGELVTCDSRLAKAPGVKVRLRLVRKA
jgi:predicted nucleic acid-binding protein